MLPASNRGVGMNIGFPDVCLTPTPAGPVPIPYPNFALNAQAVAFSPVVTVSGVHALNMGSKIPMTFGDDAGTAHPVFKQMGTYVMGNPIVFVDRLPAINLTCPTLGNAANNALGAVVVPSAVNVFYTYARPTAFVGTSGPTSAEQAAALGDVLRGRSGEEPLSAERIDEDVGLVRIRVVTTDLPSRFFIAAQKLASEGARALILDLRGCPGGDLDAAVAWASCFFDEDTEIARIEDDEGDETIRRASLPAVYTMPLVLLVDAATASAAEIVAACMKAHGRAIVLGRRTYGKGSAQRFVPADPGSFAYLSTARCFAPFGAPIDGVGVEPDITLSDDETNWLSVALSSLAGSTP
jgi:carboxyl-terminal processing protease